jgi:hypothetical protein
MTRPSIGISLIKLKNKSIYDDRRTMMKLYKYLQNIDEEKTLNTMIQNHFFSNSNLEEKELNKQIKEKLSSITTEEFSTIIHNKTNPDKKSLDIKAIGPGKAKHLFKLKARIGKAIEELDNYYPMFLYSKAYTRYNSILERSWEKLLLEFFFYEYFLPCHNKKRINYKKDTKNRKKIIQNNYNIIIQESTVDLAKISKLDPLQFSKDVRNDFEALYENMTEVRMRNEVFKLFEKEHKQSIKLHFNNFRNNYFTNVISFNEFCRRIWR